MVGINDIKNTEERKLFKKNEVDFLYSVHYKRI